MMKSSPIWKAIKLLFISFLVLVIVTPLLFFLTTAFSSGTDMNKFPKNIFPTFSQEMKIKHHKDDNYEIFVDEGNGYKSILTTDSYDELKVHFQRQYNINLSEDYFEKNISGIKSGNTKKLTLRKDPFMNFKQFFAIVNNSGDALKNSIITSIYTIFISLVLGSMAGYAIARYDFRFKEQISQSLLIVRMFPTVGISIPMALIMIKLGMFDTRIGLAVIYSIPNIALTSWITASVFMGINSELEEASQVFGANKLQTFFKITLPLAFPALASSSMYAFLTSWNDTISALILTSNNQTLALVIYKAIGTTSSGIQYAAAGSVILILPALVFTFIIRRYINQMWGNVSL